MSSREENRPPIVIDKLITAPFISPHVHKQSKVNQKVDDDRDNLCMRVFRKKFLCIILLLLIIYSLVDLTHLIVNKSDTTLIHSFMNMTYQKLFTSTTTIYTTTTTETSTIADVTQTIDNVNITASMNDTVDV